MISNLKVVEIEIDGYCNRRCAWCPNSTFDRTTHNTLSVETYAELMQELAENNFNGTISYSRNNEPFSNLDLLYEYTNITKQYLPNVKLVTNTNGDFITKEVLELINIDEISVMDYDSNGMEYCLNKLNEWGAIIESINENVIYANLEAKKIAYCSDWKESSLLQDRGGFFKQDIVDMEFLNNRELRNYSCGEPGKLVAIDYNGNVMACCNMRSDNESHSEFILGNLYTESLSDILIKEKSINLINQINNSIGLELPEPCQHCHKGVGRYLRNNPSIYFNMEEF